MSWRDTNPRTTIEGFRAILSPSRDIGTIQEADTDILILLFPRKKPMYKLCTYMPI